MTIVENIWRIKFPFVHWAARDARLLVSIMRHFQAARCRRTSLHFNYYRAWWGVINKNCWSNVNKSVELQGQKINCIQNLITKLFIVYLSKCNWEHDFSWLISMVQLFDCMFHPPALRLLKESLPPGPDLSSSVCITISGFHGSTCIFFDVVFQYVFGLDHN